MKTQVSISILLGCAVGFIAAGAAANVAHTGQMATITPRPDAEQTGIVTKMIEGDNSFAVVLSGNGSELTVINLEDAAANSDKALRLQDSLLEKRKVRIKVDGKNNVVDVKEL